MHLVLHALCQVEEHLVTEAGAPRSRQRRGALHARRRCGLCRQHLVRVGVRLSG